MDKLAREAFLARRAGMTYGKWKAAQPTIKKEDGIPDGWRSCKRCGKAFKPRKANHVYCNAGCRSIYL